MVTKRQKEEMEREELEQRDAATEAVADNRAEDDPVLLEEARQQREQAEKAEAAARDAAERQFHRQAHSEDVGTGIDGLLQVLYRRGLVSILEIEAILGKDIPAAEEVAMKDELDTVS